MKKLFLLLALLGMVAVGCSKDEGGNIPDDAYISLDKEIVTISPDGESVGVKVYSNYAWDLTNNCDWITTSITSGDASDTGVTVTLTADLTYDDRGGTIIFSCGKAKKLLVVSQKFKEAIIPDANNTFNIPAEGGIAVISYQTSVDCEVIIPKDAQSWITIAPATRVLVSESITLNISENTTYSARTAVVKVVANDNAELAVEYIINQEQNDAVLANGNTAFTIDGREQQITIKHKANVYCDVIIPETAQSWISLATSTRGLSTYSTTLNIAENNSGEERDCVVKVVSKDNNKLSAEYTIVQKPRYCLYYTSNDGKIVQPYDRSSFGATIISNTYKDGVGVIEFDAPITMIGYRAFYYCSSLTSITIPDSVTTIGYRAFSGCSSITSVTIPNSVTTIGKSVFSGCSSLTSVTIPDSVTEIGGGAFYGCRSLTSVTIPDSVTEIGSSTFSSCSSLTSVTIPDSVTTIGEYAFYGCTGELIIYSKIIETDYSIENHPTNGGWLKDAKFTKLTIGDSVTTIGKYAFYNCSSLTSVDISDSVTTIGVSAFYKCSSLTGVTIGDSVTTIGNTAFSSCESLTSITIPDSMTTIGDHAFYGCSSLTSVTIGDSVTTIEEYAFAYCKSLTSVTIPDSVTTIADVAFCGCSSLTSVTIGDSVTTIGDRAFYDCYSLTSVTIGDSVTKIRYKAFYDCSSLTSVTIPDSVTSIDNWAFAYCYDLTSVYCKATTPPSLGGTDVFDYNNGGRKIYVPMESVEAYKSASYWSDYADDIVGYNF